MIRAAVLAVLALALLAAPAQAFDSCSYDPTHHSLSINVTSTVTLSQSGTKILWNGDECGATTNVDTIVVDGGASTQLLTIDLSGGTFLGGFTDEGDGSSEIEILTDTEQLVVEGSTGADHVTSGFSGSQTKVNLNTDEATDDADVTDLLSNAFTDLNGGQGADVLSGGGADGTGGVETRTIIRGQEGNDDITVRFVTDPGPGDDTVRMTANHVGSVRYGQALNPVTVEVHDGAGGDWGGATADGEGGHDTFVNAPRFIVGSTTAPNVLHGGSGDEDLVGGSAVDDIRGGGGRDLIFGYAGGDTLYGGTGHDQLHGHEGVDHLFGDDYDDVLIGGPDDDEERGGAGDDLLLQAVCCMLPAEASSANGSDDLHGDGGKDEVDYADPTRPAVGGVFTYARSAPVFVDLDDVADDGAAGELDNVHSDVEDVIGGAANDTLIGDGDANALRGFAGDDTLTGGGGDDALHGLGALDNLPGDAQKVEDSVVDGGDTFDGGAGEDTVDANEGDDAIEVRDGARDDVKCGPGNDTGRGDKVDAIASDCEGIALPVELPPDPPLDTPPDTTPPPTTPPVVTPPVTTPPVETPAPKVAALLSLQSTRKCASRRRFVVRVRREIRGTVKRVTIFLNGRKVKTVTGSRIGLPIDLRGLPKGKVKVKLQVELTDGRTATDTRTYRTCATKKRKGRFGRKRA